MSVDFGSILSSIFTGGAGGLIGVLGNVANTLLAIKQQKQEHDYNIAMLPLQLNADIERIKANVALATEQGASAAFVASQEADKLDGKESAWAADVKAMVRPTCLLALMFGTVAIYTMGNPSEDMKAYIIQNITTDASMAISWYFGARASANIMQGFKSKAGV